MRLHGAFYMPILRPKSFTDAKNERNIEKISLFTKLGKHQNAERSKRSRPRNESEAAFAW